MNKLKCTIQYDGSHFIGFQVQPRGRTIQGEIERALKKMHKGNHVRIQTSGRTDKGVHAIGQVIHFESPFELAASNWKKALNTLLPKDIFVENVSYVDADFHCRYDAIAKEYRYIVSRSIEPNVFKQNYTLHFPYALHVGNIQKACGYLEGTHDFTSFSSAKDTSKGSKVRTLSKVTCEENGKELIFTFQGDGFLYHMVRIMIGTLLDVGQGRRDPEEMIALLAQKDRTLSSETAPAEGLYLWKVVYPE